MLTPLDKQGFELHQNCITTEDIEILRKEADRVSAEAGTACVRHLRQRSTLFNNLSSSNQLLALIPAGLRPVRSILFDKTPNENWPVPWHQDLTISVKEKKDVPDYGPWSHKDGCPHVQPPLTLLENMATIRIHLDETSADNGALAVIPKSHQSGKMTTSQATAYPKTDSLICECKAGDILTMAPLILHSSKRSTSPKRRRVLHFEYAREQDLNEPLEWFEAAS